MLSSLLSPCEVKLHLLQSAVYLVPPQLPPGVRLPSPSRAVNQPPATNDVLVRGLIELYVPSDRRITALKVKLRAVQTVAVLDPLTATQPVNWEETILLEKRLVIPDSTLLPPSRPSSPTRQPEAGAFNGGASSGLGRNPITSVSLLGSLRNRSLSRQPRSVSRAPAPEPVVHEERGRRTTRTSDLINAAGAAMSTSASSSRTASPTPSTAQLPTGNNEAEVTVSPSASDYPIPPYSEVAPDSNGFVPANGRSPSASSRSSSAAAAASHPHHPENPDFGVPSSPSRSRPPPVSHSSKRSTSTGFFGNLRNSASSRSRSRAPPSARRPPSGLFGSTSEDIISRASESGIRPDELDDVADVPDDNEIDGREGRSRQVRGRGRAPPPAVRAASAAPGLSQVSGVGSSAAGQVIIASPSGRGGRGASVSSAAGSGSRASSLGPSASGSATSEGLELSRGVHGFEFAFILPSDSPPYERSPYGHVRYILKATAVGAGRARSDVSVWRDIFPVANPSPDGGPTPLQVLYNDIHPTVGLLSISCTSNSISVGGIFNVDIASPLPPPDLTVYLIRISLETHIELFVHGNKAAGGPGANGKKKRERQLVPPQRRKLFERGYVPPRTSDPHGSVGDGKKSDGFIRDADQLGASDLQAVARGGRSPQSWEISAVARMPDDNAIRPSTANGTRADVRFSHVLIVDIVHSRSPEEDGTSSSAAAVGTPGAEAPPASSGVARSSSVPANGQSAGFFDNVSGAPQPNGGGTTGGPRSGSRSASKGKSKEREASQPPKPQRKIKVFTLRQPIQLPSCCVAFDSVQLPPYTQNEAESGQNGSVDADESHTNLADIATRKILRRPADLPYDFGASHIGEPGAPTRPIPRLRGWQDTSARQFGPAHEHCVCGQTLEDLRAAERALEEGWPAERSRAIRAGWGGEGEGVRRHGKIGDYVPAAAPTATPSSPAPPPTAARSPVPVAFATSPLAAQQMRAASVGSDGARRRSGSLASVRSSRSGSAASVSNRRPSVQGGASQLRAYDE
ncbi:hypothetical protein V8E36_005177 [Tilletia maclaganii]